MFLRLLIESFTRQKRRKALAGAAILLGTTAVTAMLALATTIGDRIHRELAVYGANIIVTPKAANLDVKIAGLDLKPATGGAYLQGIRPRKTARHLLGQQHHRRQPRASAKRLDRHYT